MQNYWFYLLCEGGYGVNDKGDAYSVNAIGINDAEKIVYRNLITYLTPNATYYDAYQGSLRAATDLFGRNSRQYNEILNSWYAVGVADKYTDIDNIIDDSLLENKSIVFYKNNNIYIHALKDKRISVYITYWQLIYSGLTTDEDR